MLAAATAMGMTPLHRVAIRFASLEVRAKAAAARRDADPLRAGLGAAPAARAGVWGSVAKRSADMTMSRHVAREKERRMAEGAFEMQIAVAGRDGVTMLAFSGDERRADIFAISRDKLVAMIGWNTARNPHFSEYRLPDHFGGGRITNSDELRRQLAEYDELGQDRLVDLRNAHVARIRAGLLLQGERAELAAHGAWELACRVDNHEALADVLPLLLAGLASPHSRTLRKRCAATLAMFAETEMALHDSSAGAGALPIEELVRVLHAHFEDFIERERGERSAAAVQATAEAEAAAAGARSAALLAVDATMAAQSAGAPPGADVGPAPLAEAMSAQASLQRILEPTAEEKEDLVEDPVVPDELDEMLMLLALLLRSPLALAEHARLDGDAHVLELLELSVQDVRRCAAAVLAASFRHSPVACAGFVSDGGCAPLLALAEDVGATMAVRASAASALGWALRFCRHASGHALLAERVEPALLHRIAALLLTLDVGAAVQAIARAPPERTPAGARCPSAAARAPATRVGAAPRVRMGGAGGAGGTAVPRRPPSTLPSATATGARLTAAVGLGGQARGGARARASVQARRAREAPARKASMARRSPAAEPIGAAAVAIGSAQEGLPSFVDTSLLEALLCAAWAVASMHRARGAPLAVPEADRLLEWLIGCVLAGTHFPPKSRAPLAGALPAGAAADAAALAGAALAATPAVDTPASPARGAGLGVAGSAQLDQSTGRATSGRSGAIVETPAESAAHGAAPASAPEFDAQAGDGAAGAAGPADADADAAMADADADAEHNVRWTYRSSQIAAGLLANVLPDETHLPLCTTSLAVLEAAMGRSDQGADAEAAVEADAPRALGNEPERVDGGADDGRARDDGGVEQDSASVLRLDEHWSRLADGCAAQLAQWAMQPHQHGQLGEAGAADRLARLLELLEVETARALGGSARAPPASASEAMLYLNVASALASFVALPALIAPPPAEKRTVAIAEHSADGASANAPAADAPAAAAAVSAKPMLSEEEAAAVAAATTAAAEAARAADAAAHAARPPRAHVWRGELNEVVVRSLARLLRPDDGACAYGACALWAFVRSERAAELVTRCGAVPRLLAVVRRHAPGSGGHSPASSWAALCVNWSAWAACACAYFVPSALALCDAPKDLALLQQLAAAHEPPCALAATAHACVDARVRAAATLALAALCGHRATALDAVDADVHLLLASVASDQLRQPRERRAAARALGALRADGRFKDALGDVEERALIMLVGSTDRPDLRRIGARALARISRGQRRRLILRLGGTAALLQAVRDSAAAHAHDEQRDARGEAPLDAATLELQAACAGVSRAEGELADVLPTPLCSEKLLAAQALLEEAVARRDAARAAVDVRALLPEALGALVNLSAEAETQRWLATHGMWTLTRLLDEPPAGCAPAARLCAQTLSHVASNRANRRRMYCAELQLKAKRWKEDARAIVSAASAGAGWLSASGSDDERDDNLVGTVSTHARPPVVSDFERWLDAIDERERAARAPFAPRAPRTRAAPHGVSGSSDGAHRTLQSVLCTSFERMWLQWHAAAIGDDATSALVADALSVELGRMAAAEAPACDANADGAQREGGSARGAADGARRDRIERPATAAPRIGALASAGSRVGASALHPPLVGSRASPPALARARARPSTAEGGARGLPRPSSALSRSASFVPGAPGLLTPVRFASAHRPPSAHASRASSRTRASLRLSDASRFSSASCLSHASSSFDALGGVGARTAERWFPEIVSIAIEPGGGAASAARARPLSSAHADALALDGRPARAAGAGKGGGEPAAPPKAGVDAPSRLSPRGREAPAGAVVMALDASAHLKPVWRFARSEGALPPREARSDEAAAARLLAAAAHRPSPFAVVARDESDDPRFQMASWSAHPGARYWRLHGSASDADPPPPGASTDSPFGQYALPDGALVRCYHTGVRRHAYEPADEPTADATGSFARLADVGERGLPQPPRPPALSERAKPPLRAHVHIAAPLPEEHTLPGARPDAWYGTLWTEPIMLIAVPFRPPAAEEHGYELVGEDNVPWSLDTSIFAPRKRTSDARAYYTTAYVLKRGFALDWSRCESARFQRLISLEDDGGALGLVDELAEVRTALEAKCALLYSVFTYYCLRGSAYDNFVLSMNEYTRFCDECRIPEPESRFCRQADLDTIFIAACPKDDDKAAQLGVDRALLRYQWLQVVVRIAIAKYVRTNRTHDVSTALEMLLSRDIVPNMSAFAGHDPSVFRQEQLYRQSTEAAILKYEKSLREIYRVYSASDDDGLIAHGGKMSLAEWSALMRDARMIDSHFTKRESNLCYFWSLCFVADEVGRRQKMLTMTFVDFLEALGRIAVFKPLPDDLAYRALEAAYETKEKPPSDQPRLVISNCAQFFDVLWAVGGEHALHKFNRAHERDWELDETSEGRPLAASIELVCQLLIGRIDRDGDGQVTRKDWKLRPADTALTQDVRKVNLDAKALRLDARGEHSNVELVRGAAQMATRVANKAAEFARPASNANLAH